MKRYFPKPSYSLQEVADFLHCSARTVRYWLQVYEVPVVKITGSPFILQVNLIDFLIAADDKRSNEDNNIGLASCIKKIDETHPKLTK